MATFNVNPTSTTGVQILAATSGSRARFISLGFSNNGTSQRLLTIYDGTALAGTARFVVALAPGSGDYQVINMPGKSIIPKESFTAGNSIECALDASGDVRVFGVVVADA